MIVLADVLTPEELDEVRQGLARAPFRDGKATAGPEARRVKNNEQARGADAGVRALAGLVRRGLERHPVFGLVARPARWSPLMFSRYAGGQQYGLHTDDAAMRDEHGGRLRTDLSFTCSWPTRRPTMGAPC